METVRSGTEWLAVDSATVTGAARRPALRMAEQLGFDEVRAGEVAIVVSEIAANLAKHARGARLGIQVALRRGTPGLRIIAIDQGPGMPDAALSAIDGHSTSGTLGVGLGAIGRLSSALDVSSIPGRGTVLAADLWPDQHSPDPARELEVAGITRPIAGERVCGDAVAARIVDGHEVMFVCDGLGHGPIAATVAAEALTAFHASAGSDPAAVLTAVHRRLQGTRGAAATVAVVDPARHRVAFAGVGNVSAWVDDGTKRSAAVAQPGIVGHQFPRLRTIHLPLGPGSVVIMHSDGVRENWNLRDTPGLFRRSPAVIAASLLRDSGTRPDDASILVARYQVVRHRS